MHTARRAPLSSPSIRKVGLTMALGSRRTASAASCTHMATLRLWCAVTGIEQPWPSTKAGQTRDATANRSLRFGTALCAAPGLSSCASARAQSREHKCSPTAGSVLGTKEATSVQAPPARARCTRKSSSLIARSRPPVAAAAVEPHASGGRECMRAG